MQGRDSRQQHDSILWNSLTFFSIYIYETTPRHHHVTSSSLRFSYHIVLYMFPSLPMISSVNYLVTSTTSAALIHRIKDQSVTGMERQVRLLRNDSSSSSSLGSQSTSDPWLRSVVFWAASGLIFPSQILLLEGVEDWFEDMESRCRMTHGQPMDLRLHLRSLENYIVLCHSDNRR